MTLCAKAVCWDFIDPNSKPNVIDDSLCSLLYSISKLVQSMWYHSSNAVMQKTCCVFIPYNSEEFLKGQHSFSKRFQEIVKISN